MVAEGGIAIPWVEGGEIEGALVGGGGGGGVVLPVTPVLKMNMCPVGTIYFIGISSALMFLF